MDLDLLEDWECGQQIPTVIGICCRTYKTRMVMGEPSSQNDKSPNTAKVTADVPKSTKFARDGN